MDNLKIIYISSPFSGPTEHIIEENIHIASGVAIEAIYAGWGVICPHKNTSGFQHLDLPIEFWYDLDIQLLKKCDAMVFNVIDLEKVNKSVGMNLELAFAEENNIPVIFRYEDEEVVFTWRGAFYSDFPSPNKIFSKVGV